MILFIYGPDTYRAREKVRAIKARYRERYPSAFELHEFDWSENADGAALERMIGTGGFFAPHKFIVVRDFFQAPAALIKAVHQDLKVASWQTLKDATMLMWERRALGPDAVKSEEAKKCFAWLKRASLAEAYPLLRGEAFRRWVLNELARENIVLSAKALADFCRACESDTWRARCEIEKLALGWPPQFSFAARADIFDMVRALWRRDQKKAVAAVETLLDQGENEFYILSMMAYALRKSMERVEPGRLEQLKRLHQRLVQTDLAIKTGQIEPRWGLELLALYMSR